jgi:hypothetical protein
MCWCPCPRTVAAGTDFNKRALSSTRRRLRRRSAWRYCTRTPGGARMLEMLPSPQPERFEHRPERLPVRRDSIADDTAGSDVARTARDEIVSHHLTELLAQDLRRDARQRSSKRAEAEWSGRQPLKDHRLPPASDHRDRRVERTGRAFLVDVRHGRFDVDPVVARSDDPAVLPLRRLAILSVCRGPRAAARRTRIGGSIVRGLEGPLDTDLSNATAFLALLRDHYECSFPRGLRKSFEVTGGSCASHS